MLVVGTASPAYECGDSRESTGDMVTELSERPPAALVTLPLAPTTATTFGLLLRPASSASLPSFLLDLWLSQLATVLLSSCSAILFALWSWTHADLESCTICPTDHGGVSPRRCPCG